MEKPIQENPSPNASIHQCTQRLGNKLPDPYEIAQVEPYDERDKPVFLGHYSLPPSVEKVMDMGCLRRADACDQRQKAVGIQTWRGASSPATSWAT